MIPLSSPRYGVDAPGVVRTLGLVGGLLIVVSAMILTFGGPPALLGIASSAALAGACMSAITLWMLVSSLWLKERVVQKLLAARETWRGDERVLDVGCGRGLFAINAARRVPHGRVTALDRWSGKDLTGNSPEMVRSNAITVGMAERIIVDTGDALDLPYADGAFDVIGSMTVIHNIPSAAKRAAAITEMWRVLTPGGNLLLFDIFHTLAYARQLRALGASVRVSWPMLLWAIPGWCLYASKNSIAPTGIGDGSV